MTQVDSAADCDCQFIGSGRCNRFREYSRELLPFEQDIVGPFDRKLASGSLGEQRPYGFEHRERRNKAQLRGNSRSYRQRDEKGCEKVPRFRDPVTAAPAAAFALPIGHQPQWASLTPDRTALCFGIGRVNGFEVNKPDVRRQQDHARSE